MVNKANSPGTDDGDEMAYGGTEGDQETPVEENDKINPLIPVSKYKFFFRVPIHFL